MIDFVVLKVFQGFPLRSFALFALKSFDVALRFDIKHANRELVLNAQAAGDAKEKRKGFLKVDSGFVFPLRTLRTLRTLRPLAFQSFFLRQLFSPNI